MLEKNHEPTSKVQTPNRISSSKLLGKYRKVTEKNRKNQESNEKVQKSIQTFHCDALLLKSLGTKHVQVILARKQKHRNIVTREMLRAYLVGEK